MDDFEEWIKTQPHPCLQRWAEELLTLGASWDSFRRDTKQVVADLVSGGIPLLAARDIVSIASATVNQSQSPLAIFWDLENLAIPSSSSASDVASRLKAILMPHGQIKHFRGYASIGLGNIPEKKRSELQLSGCHLVDCPHVGRKEVVDKMIIVDAMQFAFTHPDAATLCFITGDVDYAYLLAVLQQPQWKTIVISKGTLRSMLHVNCDMKMRWETDILQLSADDHKPAAHPVRSARNLSMVIGDCKRHRAEGEGEHDDFDMACVAHDVMSPYRPNNSNTYSVSKYLDAIATNPLEGLTNNEALQDDVEILRSAMRSASITAGGNINGTTARKSFIGMRLREINPARFPDRDSVREFLKMIIEQGIVIESGEGPYRTLSLVVGSDMAIVQANLPIPLSSIPERVIDVASSRPFVLFVRWPLCPKGRPFPESAYIQTTEKHAILIFKSKLQVLDVFATDPWLKAGHLVDWRKLGQPAAAAVVDDAAFAMAKPNEPGSCCAMCGVEDSTIKFEKIGEDSYCPTCAQAFSVDWVETNKAAVLGRATEVLETMAREDDLYMPLLYFKKNFQWKWPSECPTKSHACLWTHIAKQEGIIQEYRSGEAKKNKMVCLTKYFEEATASFTSPLSDTSKQADFIEDLLWDNSGWMKRHEVILALIDKFPDSMESRVNRLQVMREGHERDKFHVGKCHLGHVVVLSKEDANKAVSLLTETEESSDVSD